MHENALTINAVGFLGGTPRERGHSTTQLDRLLRDPMRQKRLRLILKSWLL